MLTKKKKNQIAEIMGGDGGMPITHCKQYIQARRETVRVKPTNGERLRNMTDEEMATWLYEHLNCRECPVAPCVTEDDIDKAGKGIRINPCECILLEWLKREEDG